MLYELFLTKKCYKNNLIDVNINKIKKVIKINEKEFSQYEIDDIKFLINMLSNYGPIKNSNWLIDDYLLIGGDIFEEIKCTISPKLFEERKCKFYPNHCSNDIKILMNNKITLFLSPKEDKRSLLNENVIFWKFKISDFSENQAEEIKVVVDDILNYLNINNKKVMIDYDISDGKTFIIIYCILAVLLMSKYFSKIIFKVLSEIKNKINFLKYQDKNSSIFQKNIIEISEAIFKYVQFYVALSLTTHSKTNSLDINDSFSVIVSDEEKQLVYKVIRLYIEFYLINNYFISSLA
jgi:hypothetical protein